jgi:hypothetical protein
LEADAWPSVPDDLVVAGMPDQEDVEAVRAEASGLAMHLGDERARRIDDAEVADPCLLLHDGRHAVGAEDHDAALGDLVELLDEYGSRGSEPATTTALWTIDRRTYTGGPKIARARSTAATAARPPRRSRGARPGRRARSSGDERRTRRLHGSSADDPPGHQAPEIIAIGTPVPGCVLAPTK